METDPKRKLFKSVWMLFFAILSVALVAYLWPSVEDRSFVYDLKGEVNFKLSGDDASEWVRAKREDPMNPGNRLKTAAKSYAEVRLNDGSLLRVGPNTELEVLSIFINPMMGVRNAQWRIISAGPEGGVYVNTGTSGSVYEIQSSDFAAIITAGSMRVFADSTGSHVIKVIEPGSKAIAMIGTDRKDIPPGNQAVIKNRTSTIVKAEKDEADEENLSLDKPRLSLSYQTPTINKSITVRGETGLKSYVFLDDEKITESDDQGRFKLEIDMPVGKVEHKISVTDTAGRKNEQTIHLERIGLSDHLLVITSPKSGITTTDEEAVIKGTVQGSKRLMLNGKGIEFFGKEFEAKVKLNFGLNTFTFISTDATGKTREQTIWLTRDKDKIEATIDIFYPTNVVTTKEKMITIKGRTSAKRIRTQDETYNISTGDFSITAKLEPGRNAIVLTAEDEDHKSTSKTILVIRVVEAVEKPEVKLGGYPAFTNKPSVTIDGTAFNTATLEIGGKKIPIEPNGYFNFILELPKDGKNTFDLVATSKDDINLAISINIWRDTKPPDLSRIEAKKVKSSGIDEENKVLVIGVIEQNCDFYVNGIKVEPTGKDDLRNVSYLLRDYTEKTVTIKAIDKAGNQSVKEIKVGDGR